MDTKKIFGRNINLLRIAAGYTDGVQFAKRLDVPYTTYMSWEHGQRYPRVDRLLAIADIFHVSLDYLFSRDSLSDTFDSLSSEDKLYVYKTIDMLAHKKDPA